MLYIFSAFESPRHRHDRQGSIRNSHENKPYSHTGERFIITLKSCKKLTIYFDELILEKQLPTAEATIEILGISKNCQENGNDVTKNMKI